MQPIPWGFQVNTVYKELGIAIGIELTVYQADVLKQYTDLIKAWANRVNLVSRGDLDYLWERHVVDSLAIMHYLPPGSLLDFGSGGGLPGIVIGIMEPGRCVTLLEATGKKVLFLRHVIQVLGLENVGVIHNRSEALVRDGSLSNSFQVISGRGVASLPTLWGLCSPFLSADGKLIAVKGPGSIFEFEKGIPENLAVRVYPYRVPGWNKEREVVVMNHVPRETEPNKDIL